MTTRYTDEEWRAIIAETESKLAVPAAKKYARPEPGSAPFAKTIDHTLLKLDANEAQIDSLCAEARVDRFATVCVRPNFVRRCVNNLKGTDVGVACVIGFHEGTYDLAHKSAETRLALDSGATELDLVINYVQLKAQEYSGVYTELAALRTQAPHPTKIKLILETSQLDRGQIVAACVLAAAAKMDFVKTSTGFNGPGASEEHVRLMKALCEALAATTEMQVKASGGIRTLVDAVTMLEAGATRLGTSGGVWIAKEGREAQAGAGVQASRPGLETRLFTDY